MFVTRKSAHGILMVQSLFCQLKESELKEDKTHLQNIKNILLHTWVCMFWPDSAPFVTVCVNHGNLGSFGSRLNKDHIELICK